VADAVPQKKKKKNLLISHHKRQLNFHLIIVFREISSTLIVWWLPLFLFISRAKSKASQTEKAILEHPTPTPQQSRDLSPAGL
jgi:hypothetical protein